MLSGDNGLLKRAGDARDDTVVGQEKEQVELAYISAAVKKLGDDVTEGELQIELDSSVGNEKTDVSTNDDSSLNVYFVDTEHNYMVDNNGNVEKYIEPELITVAEAKSAGTVFTSKTTLKDDYNNKVVVPKGFKIASGDEGSSTNVVGGVVIEDADVTRETVGSQFVWIPVGTIYTNEEQTTNETIELGRYSFNVTTGVSSVYSSTCSEDTEINHDSNFGNAIAKNIEDYINSVNKNGGYYIARYEAGIEGYTSLSTSNNSNNVNWSGYEGGNIVSKQNVQVYNYITQNKASELSKIMYSEDVIKSDLINSYSWDTAILYIQTLGVNGNDSSKYSAQRGYSAIGGVQKTGTNTLKYVVASKTTVRETPIIDKQCNIYDMAGNVPEWTTETESSSSVNPCICRGGIYNEYKNRCTGYRSNNATYDSGIYCGFRVILYF